MTNPTPSIPDLVREEIEAWRIYQLHAVETERLRVEWTRAERELRAAETVEPLTPTPCTTA